jgi:predicted acyl esterase
MSDTGRTTNILLTEAADPSVKPTSWPQYQLGPEARPEANREWSCYPVTAEEKGVKILPAGWSKESRRRKASEDILFDQNVSIPLRDGVQLDADVFRSPKTQEGNVKVPTVLMYGPYGKSGTGPQQVREEE